MARGIVIRGNCTNVTIDGNRFFGLDADIEIEKGGRLEGGMVQNNLSISLATIEHAYAAEILSRISERSKFEFQTVGDLKDALQKESWGKRILDEALQRGANLASILDLVLGAFRG